LHPASKLAKAFKYVGPHRFVKRNLIKIGGNILTPGFGGMPGKIIAKYPGASIAASGGVLVAQQAQSGWEIGRLIHAAFDPDEKIVFDPGFNTAWERWAWGDGFDIFSIQSSGGGGPGDLPVSTTPPSLNEGVPIVNRPPPSKPIRSRKRCPPGFRWNGTRCVKR